MNDEKTNFPNDYSLDNNSGFENSNTFLDSAYFAPETVLPSSYSLKFVSEDNKTIGQNEREDIGEIAERIRRAKEIQTEEEKSSPTFGIGLIASISIGILIAVFLFPAVRYAERTIRSYVAGNWSTEINRRVGQYDQIYGSQGGGSPQAVMEPVNLAFIGWEELNLKRVAAAHLPVDETATRLDEWLELTLIPATPPVHVPYSEADVEPQIAQDMNAFLPGRNDVASYFDAKDFSIPLEVNIMSEHILLIFRQNNLSQSGMVRSAHGQGVSLQGGRIFTRILPSE